MREHGTMLERRHDAIGKEAHVELASW